MTRNFRDEWDVPASEGAPQDAPARVQDEISALLRRSAHEAPVTIPADVEARIRAALAGEARAAGAPADSSTAHATPTTAGGSQPALVPLPTRDEAPTRAVTPDRSDDVTLAVSPREVPRDVPRTVRAVGPSDTAGASVTSLSAHRERKQGRFGKVALAMGAAAAVAIGTVAAVQMNKGEDAQVADPGVSASSAAPGTNYASRVRVTQTETSYTKASLSTQAGALPASTSTPIEPVQANAQSLGPLATGEGVQSCLDAVAQGASNVPDKVYADFATYDGAPAVVVVTVKGSTKTAWVVSRSCSKVDDVLAGPTQITT